VAKDLLSDEAWSSSVSSEFPFWLKEFTCTTPFPLPRALNTCFTYPCTASFASTKSHYTRTRHSHPPLQFTSTFRFHSPLVMVGHVLLSPSSTVSFCFVRKDISAAMASVTKTDSPSLKRTYTLVSSSPSSPSDLQEIDPPSKVPALAAERRMTLSLKRRYPFCKSQTTVSGNNSSISTVPAFVSIFDTDMSGCSPVKETSHFSSFAADQLAPAPGMTLLQNSIHKSHSSVSTSASSSNNSSPTTTISTVDTSEEQITPDSSPDSSGSLMALPSFRSRGRVANDLSIVPPSPGLGCGRPQSPSKKPRNTKNLSLHVPPSPMPQLSTAATDDGDKSKQSSAKSISAPSSPAFIMPPPPQNPRRRPSHLGLTIKLPATLSEKPLRHHQSSPSLFSPGLRGPVGGMTLPQSANFRQTTFQFQQRPVFNNRWASETASSGPSSAESNSPPKSPEILHEMDEEEDEPPRSGEAKSPAYPAGPALIFEPNIYLYAEPNAELASQFDVIINVAREVLNPFKGVANKGVANSPVPDTACTESSFKTAYEDAMFSPVSVRDGSVTPKPKQQEPEYIHMPWDHNTPILDDLPALVELINERSNEGKKVLVHCQCGVSRSATLLIAYSMFKNPEKSMQDAYSAVKAKSRWIGPNMSLIYQLTDWKKMISTEAPKTAFTGWRGAGPATAGLRNTMKGLGTGGLGRGRGMDCDDDSGSIPEPQTAPLPERRNSPSVSPMMSPMELKPDSRKPQLVRTRSASGGFKSAISPGPSSAPPGLVSLPGSTLSTQNRQSWPDGDAKLYLPTGEPSPQPQQDPWPSTRGFEPPEPTRMPPPPPPRASSAYTVEKGFRMPGGFESDVDDNTAPPTPSITSPRNSGFWATMPSRRMSTWGAIFSDPRSPTERGTSTPVIRNIFDVL